MAEVTETTSAEPTIASEAAVSSGATPTERRPKAGELVAFGEGTDNNPNARWFACVNVTFKRPSGDTGTLDWVVVTPEALEAAGGDPLKVKFVGSVVIQEAPPQRVVELPDMPVAEA